MYRAVHSCDWLRCADHPLFNCLTQLEDTVTLPTCALAPTTINASYLNTAQCFCHVRTLLLRLENNFLHLHLIEQVIAFKGFA